MSDINLNFCHDIKMSDIILNLLKIGNKLVIKTKCFQNDKVC